MISPFAWTCGASVLAAALVASWHASAAAQNADSVWLASTGFYLRRAEALVHYDRADLGPRRGLAFSRLVDEAEGVDARRAPPDGRVRLRFRTEGDGATECVPDVYFNGSRMERRLAATDVSLDQLIRVADLDGIEVFAPEDSPIGDGSGCATILVWSYRRAHRRDPEFTGVLRGRAVREADGEGVSGIVVAIEPGGLRQTTGADGRFDFGSLPPASYRLKATTPSGQEWTAEVRVRAYSASEMMVIVEQPVERGVR